MPAVVAVLVVSGDAGEQSARGAVDAARSLTVQDYPNLSVLVIADGAPAEVVERVAEVAPDAFVHRLQRSVGFAAAANQALSLVEGGAFLLFCDERVVLEAGCVRALMEELYRSNAGIVTPKYLRFEDPRRIDAIGMGSDPFAVQVDLVESGDFDQEQYDHVSDVFVAPRGVQLVRADLFRTLGGFDAAMAESNEDLDLSWRAQAVGARVLAAPAGVALRRSIPVQQADQSARRRGDRDRRRMLERSRLRTILVTQSRLSLAWILPLAVLQLVVAGLYGLIAGRRRQLGDVFDAVGWNLSRFGEIRRRRKELDNVRQLSDREIRAMQLGSSARLNAFVRGQFAVGDRVVDLAASVRDSFSGDDSDKVRDATVIGAFVGFLLLLGSRGLISEGVTPIGQFLDLPGTGDLWREWWGGWRGAGMGGPGNPATAFGVLAVLRTVFFWTDGVPTLLLTLIPLAAGPVGVWRLVRPLGSSRASAMAVLAYSANPLLVAIVTAGRWDALVVWGTAPWIMGSVLRLQALAPFGPVRGTTGFGIVERDVPTRLIRLGLVVALGATFVPAMIPVAAGLLLAAGVGAVLTARPAGNLRLGLGALVIVVVPGALHAPYTFDVVRRFDWAWLVGPPSPETSFDSLADLVRFAPGIGGIRLLALGLLLAAVVPLLVGRGARFDLGVIGWSTAVVFWLMAWADRRGWMFEMPTAEILLVPAAVGIAMAVGAGTRAAEMDLADRTFSWRPVVAFGGTVAIASAGILLLQSAVNGRWGLPTQSHAVSVALSSDSYEGPVRVLWLGPGSVLPMEGHVSPGGTSYAVSGERADARGRWVPGPYGLDDVIGQQLDLASAGETSRLGRLLAPYGIDLIVVVPTVAPAPYVGMPADPGGGIVTALARQFDLQRVTGTPDLFIYRNSASQGPAVAVPAASLPASADPSAVLALDLSSGVRIDADSVGSGHWRGPTGDQQLESASALLAVPADGWVSNTASLPPATALDGLLVARLDAEGRFDVHYRTPLGRRLALIGQLALVAAGVALAQTQRPAEKESS